MTPKQICAALIEWYDDVLLDGQKGYVRVAMPTLAALIEKSRTTLDRSNLRQERRQGRARGKPRPRPDRSQRRSAGDREQ